MKMELSKRLTAVASLVTAGYRVADIGTDHGYVPIYLTEQGMIPGAVAMDVNPGPLERAAENIRAHGLETQIQTRLSDGFAALKPGEADTAVIAGMGGALTVRILSEGAEVVRSLKECVLQPQSEIEKVRSFLLEKGFLFIREDMVEEDGKYYPMMKVQPPSCDRRKDGTETEDAGKTWSTEELRYGRLLLEQGHPVLRQYLLRELRIKEQILRGIEGQETERAALRRKELEEELDSIKKGMNYDALQRNHTGH